MQFHGEEVRLRRLLKVVNDRGVPFNVIIYALVKPNRYGKHYVAFYDAQYVAKFGPKGQFVSSYYAETLLEDRQRLSQNGLCLDGGIPAWGVTGANMKKVFQALDRILKSRGVQ